MHFGPWYALADAIERAPDTAGVVQLRAPIIFAYARGQSAMVYYGSSCDDEPLSAYMLRRGRDLLTHAEKHGACWIRYGETEQPERELSRLLKRFEARFGSPPVGNAVLGAPD